MKELTIMECSLLTGVQPLEKADPAWAESGRAGYVKGVEVQVAA